jgi:hypothetical protein
MIVRNAFGNAETVTVKSAYGIDNNPGIKKDQGIAPGVDGASGHLISFAKPLNGNPNTTLECTAFKSEKNHSNYMGFQETNQGISLTETFSGDDYRYRIGAETVWRENHSVRNNCPLTYELVTVELEMMLVIL